MTHLVLRNCLEGLEDFLELLLDWPGLFKDLLRSFRNGDMEIYTVDYLQCQIYGALALFNEKARVITDRPTRPADFQAMFRKIFSELKSKLTFEACHRYEKFKAAAVGIPPSGLAIGGPVGQSNIAQTGAARGYLKHKSITREPNCVFAMSHNIMDSLNRMGSATRRARTVV